MYVSYYSGERVKINMSTTNIIWAFKYSGKGESMAMSTDKSFLLVDGENFIGK